MSGTLLAAQGIPLMISANPTGAAPVGWANEPDRLEAGPTGGTGFQPVAVRWQLVEGRAECRFQRAATGWQGGQPEDNRRR
jgi:hypothetical protein